MNNLGYIGKYKKAFSLDFIPVERIVLEAKAITLEKIKKKCYTLILQWSFSYFHNF